MIDLTQDQIDALIDQTASAIVREVNGEIREEVAEILRACRPPEHVRPVNVDRMGKWLSGRVAA